MPFLFERLSVRPYSAAGQIEAFDEEAAILAQVQRIVATWRRNGDAIATVPWGLQGVEEIGYRAKGQLTHYAERLAAAIATHEPRLQNVRVSIEPTADPLNPQYLLISAIFPGDDLPRSLRLAAGAEEA